MILGNGGVYMNRVICNIPHSSLEIPEWALNDFIISDLELKFFNEKMVDKDVDKLFDFVKSENKVVSNISRIVVDMERFEEDTKEEMAKKGMGLFYTKDDFGKEIRRKGSTYSWAYMHYKMYHSELNAKVRKCINKNQSCYILDCHSFHDGLEYTGYSCNTFPDVCIGLNSDIITNEIREVIEVFEKAGYYVNINKPFSGSLIPSDFSKDKRVKSLMIELNRRIYCSSLEDFEKVKYLCKQVYRILNEC